MEWNGNVLLLTFVACPVGCLSSLSCANLFVCGFTKTRPTSAAGDTFNTGAMRGTIVRCLDTGVFVFVATSKDAVLVLGDGEDGGGMFAAKGRFETAGCEGGERFLVGCWGDCGYSYDVLG
jgi:hypothetical protein